jgi:hypothetical protein
MGGVLAGKTLTQVSTGSDFACALDTAGAAYCWGDNNYGELGDGNTKISLVPVAVDTRGALAGKTITQISAWGQPCALDSAGSAYCWGQNSSGQLGDGSDQNSSVPVSVDMAGVLAGKSLTQVSVGGGHTCALDSSGAAYCWGDNEAGDLGDHSTSMSEVPVLVGSDAAAPISGAIVLAHRKTKCADDSGDARSNGTKIVMWECNRSPAQNWTIATDGTIRITGKCLAIRHGEKTNMAPIELWTCTGGASQQWRPVSSALVNPISGKCLEDPSFNTTNGTQLVIYTCSGLRDQQWTLP